MAQITSREELEEWLKEKPADWTQVIAVRAALRVLPFAFVEEVNQKWVSNFALSLFRANAISWFGRNCTINFMAAAGCAEADAVNNYSTRAVVEPIFDADALARAGRAARVYAGAANAAYCAVRAAASTASLIDNVADAIDNATDAIDNATTVWENIIHDCEWLAGHAVPSKATRRLTHRKLWPLGKPDGWVKELAFADVRLAALDQGFGVWIKWYDRRVKGRRAAFDIPGDTDRTHDKAILARLADATDEDFWGKGATYVNTTLQGWIDEARIDARIDQITAKLRGGAIPHYGTPEALAARAALEQELDRLLTEPSDSRLKIGGNQPPEEIDVVQVPVALPPAIREPIAEIRAELEAPKPDTLKIADQSKLLLRLINWRADVASATGDHFAKGFGEEFGKLVAGDVHKLLRVAVVGLLAAITAFLGLIIGLIF